MQSCNGIPKVWVGVVSLMAIVWMLPFVQILFQFRLPLCLQFVDGDYDQAEWQRLLPNQVSTHERQHGGCMQSCNGIPKVWVGVLSLMAIVWMLPLVQIYSNSGFLFACSL